jgi:hypothetical protein
MGSGKVLQFLFSEESKKLLKTQQQLKQAQKEAQNWNPKNFIFF